MLRTSASVCLWLCLWHWAKSLIFYCWKHKKPKDKHTRVIKRCRKANKTKRCEEIWSRTIENIHNSNESTKRVTRVTRVTVYRRETTQALLSTYEHIKIKCQYGKENYVARQSQNLHRWYGKSNGCNNNKITNSWNRSSIVQTELSAGWSVYSGGSFSLTKQMANSKRCHKNRNMSNLTIKLRYSGMGPSIKWHLNLGDRVKFVFLGMFRYVLKGKPVQRFT